MQLGTMQQSWLNALKSGNYRQITGQLSCKNVGSKSRNCCLGVYCRVFNRLHPNVIEIEDDGWGNLSFDGKDDELSDKLRKSVKMRKKAMAKLMELNDDSGLTFKEIAAAIEENPSKFFYGPA